MPKKKKDEILEENAVAAQETPAEEAVATEIISEDSADGALVLSKPIAQMLSDYAAQAPAPELGEDAEEAEEPEAVRVDLEFVENEPEDAEITETAPTEALVPAGSQSPVPKKKSFRELQLNKLDRKLSAEERQEWNSIYASYRARSIISGTVIGADTHSFKVMNLETNTEETRTITSLVVVAYRVKVLIPETELWMHGEERPQHLVRSMVGSRIDFVVLEIDREGEVAIASRRMASAAKRRFFMREPHKKGSLLKCGVIAVGAKRCSVECNGFDFQFYARDMSYTAISDLREKFRPGQELDCRIERFDAATQTLEISVKDGKPNPFIGAEMRHPIGCRRVAVISGKYAGGVFCTLPDETVCLCLYSTRHADADFRIGDDVIILIQQFNHANQQVYGRILAKW